MNWTTEKPTQPGEKLWRANDDTAGYIKGTVYHVPNSAGYQGWFSYMSPDGLQRHPVSIMQGQWSDVPATAKSEQSENKLTWSVAPPLKPFERVIWREHSFSALWHRGEVAVRNGQLCFIQVVRNSETVTPIANMATGEWCVLDVGIVWHPPKTPAPANCLPSDWEERFLDLATVCARSVVTELQHPQPAAEQPSEPPTIAADWEEKFDERFFGYTGVNKKGTLGQSATTEDIKDFIRSQFTTAECCCGNLSDRPVKVEITSTPPLAWSSETPTTEGLFLWQRDKDELFVGNIYEDEGEWFFHGVDGISSTNLDLERCKGLWCPILKPGEKMPEPATPPWQILWTEKPKVEGFYFVVADTEMRPQCDVYQVVKIAGELICIIGSTDVPLDQVRFHFWGQAPIPAPMLEKKEETEEKVPIRVKLTASTGKAFYGLRDGDQINAIRGDITICGTEEVLRGFGYSITDIDEVKPH